jgi:hypothetical protein
MRSITTEGHPFDLGLGWFRKTADEMLAPAITIPIPKSPRSEAQRRPR